MGVAEKDDTIVYMCVLNQTGKRTDDIMVSLAAKDGNLSKKFYMMQMPEIRIQYNKNSFSLCPRHWLAWRRQSIGMLKSIKSTGVIHIH